MEMPDTDRMCGGGFTCPGGTFCSAVDPFTGIVNANPANGMISFDDFPFAVLTVFTMMTLEGWTDVMYMIQDGFTPWAWTYFVILIGLGTFIAINMFLAVISAGYEKQAEEVDEEKTMQDHAEFLLKRLSESINDALTYDHTQSEQPTEQRTNINVGDAVRLKDSAFSKFAERGRGNLTQEGGTTPVGKVLYFDRELDPTKDKDDPANLPENRNGKMKDPHRVRVTTRGIEQLKPPKGTVVHKLISAQKGVDDDYWYELEDIERTQQTKEDNEREAELEAQRIREFDFYKSKRIEKFFDYFDEDKSDCVDKGEFVKGLRKLAKDNPPTDPTEKVDAKKLKKK